MQSLAGGIDGRLLLPYGDLFSRRALLQKRLHGDDAPGANGPDPRHRNVEVPFTQPAGADEPPEHEHPRAVILEALWHRPQAPIGDSNAAKPSPKSLMADGGPLPFEEAEHRRPADLRVDQREQLLQVARLPGQVDPSHQLDALGLHRPQCPATTGHTWITATAATRQ